MGPAQSKQPRKDMREKKILYHQLSSDIILGTHLHNTVQTDTQSTELFSMPLVVVQAWKITTRFTVQRYMSSFPSTAGERLHRHLLQTLQFNCSFHMPLGRRCTAQW